MNPEYGNAANNIKQYALKNLIAHTKNLQDLLNTLLSFFKLLNIWKKMQLLSFIVIFSAVSILFLLKKNPQSQTIYTKVI